MSDPQTCATWLKVLATLDEARARWFVAQKAIELGRGGVQHLPELTGRSRPTIQRGIRELQDEKPLVLDNSAHVRRHTPQHENAYTEEVLRPTVEDRLDTGAASPPTV